MHLSAALLGVLLALADLRSSDDWSAATDPHRKVLYVGEAQLLTAAGPLPLSFEIEAASLGEAAERFGTGAKAAVERAMQELQEMRREAASSIVIPGRDQLGLGRSGPGPGGGKIQFP